MLAVQDVGLYAGRKRLEYARDRGLRGDCPSPADLETFTLKRRTDADDATFNVVQINGGEYDLSKPDEEPNQNIQYALAMAYPTPLNFYSVGGGKRWKYGSIQPCLVCC